MGQIKFVNVLNSFVEQPFVVCVCVCACVCLLLNSYLSSLVIISTLPAIQNAIKASDVSSILIKTMYAGGARHIVVADRWMNIREGACGIALTSLEAPAACGKRAGRRG